MLITVLWASALMATSCQPFSHLRILKAFSALKLLPREALNSAMLPSRPGAFLFCMDN